jgi:hypothetical protein
MLDPIVTKLAKQYRRSDSLERKRLRDSISEDQANQLYNYARDCAEESLRLRSMEPIQNGLAAFALGGTKIDWRDILIVFSLYHDAAERIGQDFLVQLEEDADLADGYFRQIAEDWLERDEDDRSLEMMNFEIIEIDGVWRYRTI